MKLYKEMLRKLAAVGLPLLAITMVYTLVKSGADCFGAYYIMQSTAAISMIPVLRYYVFTAVLFALYGFSFQFSRAGSDVYHSLPVKRTELYAAVMLATASWMGATIVINEIEMLLIYLVGGCPFVPAYIPLSILYYFVASMLVFAAAAVGCAVSGTFVTALASTGIVLLLPRYVQFLFARGIVERVPIIGWLDFGALLNPTTNAATGILVMHLRQVYGGHLITMPHILYSLIPMTLTMFVGLWLFQRRPSEIAQRNTSNKTWTVITSILLSFAVLLPITMNHQKLFSVYGFVLMAAALGVFIVYQIIVSQKIKKALRTLPYFLIAVMAVLAVSGLIDTAADSMLNKTPAAADIESVTFRGYDMKIGETTYSTILTQDIAFTDGETKAYVARALQDAVDEIQSDEYTEYYEYNRFQVIEPVEIKLSGGGTIKRTIEFEDVNELNALRMQNAEFANAISVFPPQDSIQFLSVGSKFTDEEEQAILQSFVDEAMDNGLFSNDYYRDRTIDLLPEGYYQIQGKNQDLTEITVTGYIGSKRYGDSYSIRLNTPQTASLLMRTYNAYVPDDNVAQINDVIKMFDEGLSDDDDSLRLYLSIYNYVNDDGLTIQNATDFYCNNYGLTSEYRYDTAQIEYMHAFADILSRTVLTDEPEGLFIRLNWYYRYEGMEDDGVEYTRPVAYIRFENDEDEQEFLTLLKEWEDLQRTF